MEYPIQYKHPVSGAKMTARNEMEEHLCEREGFEVVEKKKPAANQEQ